MGRSGEAVRSWHPILAAREVRVGEWWMVDGGGVRYRIIVSLNLATEDGPRPCYRVVSGESDRRRLLGYFGTLKAACDHAHHTYLAEAGPGLSSMYGHVDPGERPLYPLAAVEFQRRRGAPPAPGSPRADG